ncbi:Protein of unknown function [Gryllus bimaculatus]|nr:Protein of unknown function [Gryllus bimaculatus]
MAGGAAVCCCSAASVRNNDPAGPAPPASKITAPCLQARDTARRTANRVVARGVIRGVQNKPELEVTELTVKVTKMLRRSTDAAGGLCAENEVSPLGDCEGYEETPSASATPAAPTAVSLQVSPTPSTPGERKSVHRREMS